LQQIRFPDGIELSCTIEENTVQDEEIAPFLLIPFIENSFKHCINEITSKGWITIHLSLQNSWLILKVENSKTKKNITNEPQDETTKNKGIGLTNAKRRLELLYTNAHALKIIDSEDSFFVLLKIKVN
jgi:two-component system, LytTR family, sensor kinase